VISLTATSPAICNAQITVRGLAPPSLRTMIINTHLSTSELSLADLNGVSGGSDVRGAVVGVLVQYAIDTVFIADGIKKLTGTLKGLTPRPPK